MTVTHKKEGASGLNLHCENLVDPVVNICRNSGGSFFRQKWET